MKSVNNSLITAPIVMNTTINSNPEQLENIYCFAIQAVYTGTPTGTLKLQCSCDSVYISPRNSLSPQTPVNWTDIANSAQPISTAGNFVWNVLTAGYTFVRLVYTDASGGTSTASLTSVVFNGKGA